MSSVSHLLCVNTPEATTQSCLFNFVNKIKYSSGKKNIHLNNEEDYEYAMSYADEEFGSELYESLAKEMKSCETTIDISTDEILTYIKEVLA